MNKNKAEIIEAFIKGDLSEADKVSIESQMEQDPLFKSEVELQKDIINSLKSFRKNELKDRLNKVDVSSTSYFNYTAMKIAASLLITAFLSYGIYYYINSNSEETKVEIEENNESKSTSNSSEVLVDGFKEPQHLAKKNTVEEKTPATKPVSKPKVSKEAKENIVTPNVIDTFEEGQSIVKENIVTNSSESGTLTASKISDIEISHEETGNSQLMYKYLNKKLYLYGDFSQSPYELLELNSNAGKALFLYHNNRYYQLVDGQKNVTSLKSLSDSIVIKELDTLREHQTN